MSPVDSHDFFTAVEKTGENIPKSQLPSSTQDLDPDPSLSLEDLKQKHDIELLKQELEELKDTHTLRLKFAKSIFWVVVLWLLFVSIILVMEGFWLWDFSLSDAILITILTTTSINIIGLLVIVAKWLFPNGK